MKFVLVVHLRIKPENVSAFMPRLKENAAGAKQEPGCRQFEIVVDPKDETRLLLFEVYDDEQAFEAHQASAHFKRFLAEAVPLLESRERSVWAQVES